MSSHTTSLPLSLALREAGYPQGKSIFVYRKYKYQEKHVLELRESLKRLIVEDELDRPLASELGEALPTMFDGCRIITQHGLMGNRWFVTLENMTTHEEVYRAEEKTEADARANMWLHIHSQKII